jgi:hypothetical protein
MPFKGLSRPMKKISKREKRMPRLCLPVRHPPKGQSDEL